MAHQRPADSLSLIFIDHRKSDFCFPWFMDDIASATDKNRLTIFFNYRDQSNVVDKVNIQEIRDFLI